MFNINKNNRIVMAQHPVDMRMGIYSLCGQVRMVGLNPLNGEVYAFVNKSRKVMKLLHWESGGYVVYHKHLEQGRFHPRIFLRNGIGFHSLPWSELVLLMEGISPKCARRHRYNPVLGDTLKDGESAVTTSTTTLWRGCSDRRSWDARTTCSARTTTRR